MLCMPDEFNGSWTSLLMDCELCCSERKAFCFCVNTQGLNCQGLVGGRGSNLQLLL